MTFQETVMTGLARDGGLFLPIRIPDVRSYLSLWKTLSYRDLAFEIMRLYTDIPDVDLRNLTNRSYSAFRHPEVTPVVSVNGIHILELFHGPTLSFKDVALQWLGLLFDYWLSKSGQNLNILAATSGDTGSAAIYGVKGRQRMKIFVLYPYGKISPIQELQMTTVPDNNVFCIAVEGSFDDCQNVAKTIFRDLAFKDRCVLGAVNSINWARILAQIVYYFYAAFRVMEQCGAEYVRFAVPTGNFGDIFAGYLACRMGLPVKKLVLASNENDILSRFFKTGVYKRSAVRSTISPSMDIQIASNFERYLYYHVGEDPQKVCRLMNQFAETGELTIDLCGGELDPLFAAGFSDDKTTIATIRDWYLKTGYLLDPHTAVGVHVAQDCLHPDEPMICLATAHPAKFADVIHEATGRNIAHHTILDALKDIPARSTVLPASIEAVCAFIEKNVKNKESV